MCYLLNIKAVSMKSSHQIISDEITTVRVVARATTRTVVISSLMIWWLDFMLTALMFSK